MKLKILKPGYNKSKFYSELGIYFGERRYRKEMPYLINDDNMTWFIYFDGDNIAGFASINTKKSLYSFENAYIIEEYREQSIWTNLINDRLKYVSENNKSFKIKTIVSKELQIDHLLRFDFKITKQSKNYTFMELDTHE